MSCRRSSGGVSMRILVPLLLSTTAPTRLRVSRGSGERQTSQWQPSCGTPKLVPVPRKVSFTGGTGSAGRRARVSYRLHLQEIGGTRHVERNTSSYHDTLTGARQTLSLPSFQRQPHHLL